ncbi:MAG: anthranilate phosphoribosyltransferase [Candidatus Goldbacteria bacterium]|nr:anthranilate phosphoribosyltransferase [Candidatus Goldiibacteriota bacterium]HPD18662.1 anthranilate phosphoribosyltransferase [Candidatus Goldiibacteriota bacterium]
MLKQHIKKVSERQDLTQEEMTDAMQIITSGQTNDVQIASFITALKMKGETSDEIAAAAKVMREKTVKIKVDSDVILDTCGTGGDGLNTFNVSTATAIVCAAAGIKVAKHGNRAFTSKCGSADVLQAAGINIEIHPEKVKKSVEEINIGFIFSPNYHPAMKYAMPARKEVGIRTIFNILGPIINPAGNTHHLMGVPNNELVDKISEVFLKLGLKRGLVVCGNNVLDEIAPYGKTKVAEIKDGRIIKYEIRATKYLKREYPVEKIKGGKPEENAQILINIFNGKEKEAYYNLMALNSGFAIYICGLAKDPVEGIKIACDVIDSGKAAKKLKEFVEFTNS